MLESLLACLVFRFTLVDLFVFVSLKTEEREMSNSGAQTVDLKLEAIVIPVSNVERAKQFYDGLGWRLDGDFIVGRDFRLLQYTPPGSPCSIHFGTGITAAKAGSANIPYLVVSDIEAARAELVRRGVDVSDVFHRAGPGKPPRPGRHPERLSYLSYATFQDPDGNGWLLQEVTERFPGRVNADTTFTSPTELASALRRASSAHGEHEKKAGGQYDANWPDWYAEYMVQEQAGKPLPT
jgi:catechol 2,3-dioxygenase-like lactoylglutathione lyase family enzyme